MFYLFKIMNIQDTMEENFRKIVQHIFNNWTALKLAVEHSMGGPNSQQTAVECMNYIVQFCLHEQNLDTQGIQEALEDILDEEFETVCEDGSPQEIAAILFKFINLLKEGNLVQCQIEYQNLPCMNVEWINLSKPQVQQVPITEDSSSDENSSPQNPVEDDGWTEVKTRRRR